MIIFKINIINGIVKIRKFQKISVIIAIIEINFLYNLSINGFKNFINLELSELVQLAFL